MFKKVKTVVHSSGRVESTTDHPMAWLHEESVGPDKVQERRSLRNKNVRLGRIVSIEETLTSLVTVYASGTVVVVQWIAE